MVSGKTVKQTRLMACTETKTAARHAATRAPDVAVATFLRHRRLRRRRALASHGGGGPSCGAPRARDGIWCVGAR
jgi:hypothetical protein